MSLLPRRARPRRGRTGWRADGRAAPFIHRRRRRFAGSGRWRWDLVAELAARTKRRMSPLRAASARVLCTTPPATPRHSKGSPVSNWIVTRWGRRILMILPKCSDRAHPTVACFRGLYCAPSLVERGRDLGSGLGSRRSRPLDECQSNPERRRGKTLASPWLTRCTSPRSTPIAFESRPVHGGEDPGPVRLDLDHSARYRHQVMLAQA
jgi:hypothetical protein